MKNNVRYARSYHYKENSGIDYVWLVDNRMRILAPYLSGKAKILELGCGEGLLGERIRQETAARVYGVDISQSGVLLAKKRGIKAKVADLNRVLPFPDTYFDMIFSDQVLEHVYRTDSLLSEMFRILKPDGTVITITPNLSFWLNRILFIIGVYPMFLEAGEYSKQYGTKFLKNYIQDKAAMGHIHIFNRHALEDIFRAHGFVIVRTFGSPFSWQLPKMFQILYNMIDSFFALFPSLARDIIIIARKRRDTQYEKQNLGT